VTNSYDGFGRLASSSTSISGVTRMLSYGYDDAGNRISIKHPDGNWFGMWYDALGRRYYIHANNVLGMAMLGFAPHGGLAWVGRVGIASYIGFDAVQRPSSLAITAYTPATTDVAFSFGRNPAGQITSLTRDNDAYAWTGHYAANRAYVTNGLNQYSAAGAATFGYDLNGNLTSDGSRTYAYDIENRLVSSSNGAALTYDPLGRLFQVTLGTSTTRFLYDGDALVAEYDGGNTLLRRHAHWAGADVPVATFDVAGGTGLGTLRYLFADQQGSIIAEANGSGAVTAINRYDEYGIPASTNVGRFQYTGQAWLSEIGMYYYKARIYSPTLGRFMQTDPVGYADQINLYAYVGNDPVDRTDPSGTQMLGFNPFASEEQRDLRARMNDTLADGLWRGLQGGYALIAQMTLLAVGPEAEVAEASSVASFIAARALLRGALPAGRATAGRTTQFIGSGGVRGAAALFRQLVGDTRVVRSGNAVVGRLADGARVNIRSVVQGDIRRTTVEIQRAGQTGTRILQRLKVRFDERLG
jgi:RHS repeat-associated protein